MRFLLLITLIGITTWGGCKKEEPTKPESQPCVQEHSEFMIGKWNNPHYYETGIDMYNDSLDLEFELNLHADSTYAMEYFLFDTSFDPVVTYTLVDTGFYNFTCEGIGTFTTAFTYNYIDGILELNSFTEPARILDIRWDGLFGLGIKPEELGLGFSGRILIFRDV
ncbi:MAG: hypothetical protein DWQ02_08925 [Bacteroidetes bacterium]|nr:MAG: hypothetical protein DWQ02_08925 [Bacteroidota bacterium]